MNISISCERGEPQLRNGVLAIRGKLKIAEFKENLYIPLDWWNQQDYKKQWDEGLLRLKNHSFSCLVTAIHNPHIRKYIDWWLWYKVENKIYIQNQILFGDIYQEQIGNNPFTSDSCYDFIPPRAGSYDEDGNEISEWIVDWNEDNVG